MKTPVVVQMVRCPDCGWTGNRVPAKALDRLCFQCSRPVGRVGEPYEQIHLIAGCDTCRWWGERPAERVEDTCPSCRSGLTQPLALCRADGSVFFAAGEIPRKVQL